MATAKARSKDGTVTAQFVIITPDLARTWLGDNTHNRKLRPRRTTASAADMKTGNWPLTGDTVKRAEDDTLIDGQHRLAAIIESGTSQEILVVEGLPRRAQEAVDIGIKRNFSDILSLRGETNPMALAAVLRRVTVWESGGRSVLGSGNLPSTPAQMSATLEKHPGLREISRYAINVGIHCDLPASIIGLGMWLFAQIDESDSEFFFERLADGQNLAKGDAIYELRRTLADSRNIRGRRSDAFLTAIMIKAWNAYRGGTRIAFLTYKPGGARPEAFPEPQ
jgi:hypothetical protein